MKAITSTGMEVMIASVLIIVFSLVDAIFL